VGLEGLLFFASVPTRPLHALLGRRPDLLQARHAPIFIFLFDPQTANAFFLQCGHLYNGDTLILLLSA
jgi:hypothetical protein